MRHMLRGAVGAALILSFAAVPAAGQLPRRTPGFWAGAIGGYGFSGSSCGECRDLSRAGGLAAGFGVGRTFSPTWQLALEVNGWVDPLNGARTTYGFADLVLYYYPLGHPPLVLGVGAGYSRYSARVQRGGQGITARSDGLGGQLSLGYDLRAGAEFTLTPTVSYHQSLSEALSFEGTDTRLRLRHSLLQVGLGIRWRWSSP